MRYYSLPWKKEEQFELIMLTRDIKDIDNTSFHGQIKVIKFNKKDAYVTFAVYMYGRCILIDRHNSISEAKEMADSFLHGFGAKIVSCKLASFQ